MEKTDTKKVKDQVLLGQTGHCRGSSNQNWASSSLACLDEQSSVSRGTNHVDILMDSNETSTNAWRSEKRATSSQFLLTAQS